VNRNLNKAFRKTKNGTFGWYCGYSIYTEKRFHGGYYCRITRGKYFGVSEGFSGSYLKTLHKVKTWVKQKVNANQLQRLSP
jgi:hypothetical protein